MTGGEATSWLKKSEKIFKIFLVENEEFIIFVVPCIKKKGNSSLN